MSAAELAFLFLAIVIAVPLLWGLYKLFTDHEDIDDVDL